MFRRLLNPDNPLMITMSQISDCIFLSLFWVLGCFPILTVGASTAALYDAAFRAYRQHDKHSWQRFIQVFRDNLKPGLVPTAVFLAVFALLVSGLIRVWNAAVYGALSWTVFSGVAFLGMAVLGILGVMFPMLSRFENPTGTLLKNTVLLALVHLPRTLILGLINAVVLILCFRFVLPLFFLPALAALAGSYLLEPMFRPYMPESDDEEMPLE